MADEQELGEFECPSCRATVEPDWAACPNCGVEFAPPEEGLEEPPAAAAPLPQAAATVTPLGGSSPGDDLDDLEKEIKRAAPPPPKAATPPKAPSKPPAGKGAKGKASSRAPPKKGAGAARGKRPASGSPIARMGGPMGALGLLLLMGGVVGAVLALNWDTWIQGASQESFGLIQQMAALGMVAAIAVGAVMSFLVRRKPRTA